MTRRRWEEAKGRNPLALSSLLVLPPSCAAFCTCCRDENENENENEKECCVCFLCVCACACAAIAFWRLAFGSRVPLGVIECVKFDPVSVGRGENHYQSLPAGAVELANVRVGVTTASKRMSWASSGIGAQVPFASASALCEAGHTCSSKHTPWPHPPGNFSTQ